MRKIKDLRTNKVFKKGKYSEINIPASCKIASNCEIDHECFLEDNVVIEKDVKLIGQVH